MLALAARVVGFWLRYVYRRPNVIHDPYPDEAHPTVPTFADDMV